MRQDERSYFSRSESRSRVAHRPYPDGGLDDDVQRFSEISFSHSRGRMANVRGLK